MGYGDLTPDMRERLKAAAAHDAEIDARIDRYHDGYGAFREGRAMPTETDARDGWLDAQQASLVRVVMSPRPEGYYHAAPGTFD